MLENAIKEAQNKQKEAHDQVKKLERDMEEFKNNKEGKIDELKVSNIQSVAYARLTGSPGLD